ncbi:flagellar associated [Micractinium conductrix]|uniref:Flagellar associated n=1 Tax=Micractinium conductrix TaxID=554055 RepID=A0A2P6VCP5_9CHLO|nr:flagellar associated [Micractinium conductrix]|eukprot:PSC71858.1 flagellar associated [Micractinium conductrix]
MVSAPAMTAAEAFARYDRNRTGKIEVEELRALLADLGLLAGRCAADTASFVVQQFALADKMTKDGGLDMAEFGAYYAKVTAPRLLDDLVARMPLQVQALRAAFLSFASFGAPRSFVPPKELDGARFIKLCKETGLVGKALSTTDCDIMFAKCKERSARKITFEQFVDCVGLLASKTGGDLDALIARLGAAGGPCANGVTAAEAVRFHDDVSSYTGVHAARRRSDASDASPVPRRVSGAGAAPAPAPRRTSGAASASPVPRRTSVGAAGRRTSIGAPAAVPAATRRRTSVGSDAPAAAPTPRRRTSLGYRAVGSAAAGIATPGGRASLAGDQSCSPLEAAFRSFASFGAGSSPAAGKVEMDSKQFVKLLRDAGVLGGRLTVTSADLAFTKAKSMGVRRIGFAQFCVALELLAAEKGVDKEEIFAQVSECGGPSLNRTPVAAPAASGLPSEHSTPSMPCLPSVTDASAAPVEAAPAAEQEAADGWAVSAAVEEAALPAADQSSDALAVTAAEDSSAGTWAAEASGNLFAAAQVSEVCEVADVAVDADEEEETREVAADAESFEMASASADAEVASAACMSADSEVAPAMDKLNLSGGSNVIRITATAGGL